jgi:hypothetical protein
MIGLTIEKQMAPRCYNSRDRGGDLSKQANAMAFSHTRGPLPKLAAGFLYFTTGG